MCVQFSGLVVESVYVCTVLWISGGKICEMMILIFVEFSLTLNLLCYKITNTFLTIYISNIYFWGQTDMTNKCKHNEELMTNLTAFNVLHDCMPSKFHPTLALTIRVGLALKINHISDPSKITIICPSISYHITCTSYIYNMQFTDSGKEITQARHDIYRSDIIREEQIKTKQVCVF